ncbi:MAG: L-threonylcarbamoyladenylate synthase [Myxococcota bacterium]
MSGDPVEAAVARVAAGGLVAYPTETVWGLGADASSERALGSLRDFKRRGETMPISILVADAEQLADLGFDFCEHARGLAARFWPGPLTLVLANRRGFARGVARADGAVGVRCSSHPVAQRLASGLAGRGLGPLTATSLNRSGEPPAGTLEQARRCCEEADAAPLLLGLSGPDAGGARASTVVDLTGARPEVLRWGALEQNVLEPLLQEMASA